MDAHSHNLLEAYISTGGNNYYYNALTTDTSPGVYYKVSFTRDVTSAGVAINITDIKNLNNYTTPPTDADRTFLTSEINSFLGGPINGNECQTLGWEYVGSTNKNSAQIARVTSSVQAAGFNFKPIFYQAGYYVFGCADTKQFYDQQN